VETVLHSIFLGKPNEFAHHEFIKFGKGDFKNRYLVEAKRQKDAWSIKTGPEFANSLVAVCLSKMNKPVAIKGVIVSTSDLRTQLKIPIANVKQFMGIKQFGIDATLQPSEILAAMKSLPRAFFALSFKAEGVELKIKPKAPKSAKPAASGDKQPKAEFCSLKTQDEDISKELLFDLPEGKVTIIKHIVQIKDIVIPKGVSDPIQMREQSIRKGTIKRIANVDGKEIVSEADFAA
jgi:hypothetical protein